jgi:membrane peptidoglycan carboxypeptidase
MNDNRRLILEMLAAGKITAEEAERLLGALDREQSSSGSSNGNAEPRTKTKPKYMRVQVEADDHEDSQVKVNLRIPMQLLHAGVKFTSLIPPEAREHVNEAFRRKGVNFDISSLKPENLDDILDQLNDLSVDVNHRDAKVRVFCE